MYDARLTITSVGQLMDQNLEHVTVTRSTVSGSVGMRLAISSSDAETSRDIRVREGIRWGNDNVLC